MDEQPAKRSWVVELLVDIGIGLLWALAVASLSLLAGTTEPFIYIDF